MIPSPARFHSDHFDRAISKKGIKQTDRVGPAADARNEQIGQTFSFSSICRRASSPIIRWKLRTIIGYGCAP